MTVIPPANGVTIHNGDTMDVTGGASVDSTTIETGGLQTVGGSSSTSTATHTVIDGGEQDVILDGVASNTTINAGGVQRVTGEFIHEGPPPARLITPRSIAAASRTSIRASQRRRLSIPAASRT